MPGISASSVRELRTRTGLGYMDCKKALSASDGDVDKAVDWLRVRGSAVAENKAGRKVTEGTVAAFAGEAEGALAVLMAETSFVAKNGEFKKFAAQIAASVAASAGDTDPARLSCGSSTLENLRKELAMRLGENIQFGKTLRVSARGKAHSYVHHDGSLGVIADISNSDDTLGKDICLHIAASCPACVSPADMPAETVKKEREIFLRQAEASGKPVEIAAKMVEGRMKKFLAASALTGQQFVKDPSTTVGALLRSQGATVNSFATLTVSGES